MMRTITTTSDVQTMELAAALGQRLTGGPHGAQPGALVVALLGPLGAGKTCFVRGLAGGLGLDPHVVSSPTFVICQEYTSQPGRTLAHIDAYRIVDVEELETIGWEEMLQQGDLIIAVEWADRIREALPTPRIEVVIEPLDANARRIRLTTHGEAMSWLTLDDPPDASAGVTQCKVCGASVDPAGATHPFCSQRCRLADLHRWFGGKYSISRPLSADDIE